jgi:hypothetical protein
MRLEHELNDKISEVEILISELRELEEKNGKIKTICILKSTVIMMLYNVVESMLNLILHEVHDNLCEANYDTLKDKIKNMFVRHYITSNAKDNSKIIDSIISNDLKFPSFSKYNEKNNIFSGNLDAQKIDIILGLYGINKIRHKNRDKLLYIKNKRNKLSHGEMSYIEACRDKTLSEIIIHKEAVREVVKELIISTDVYISRKLFMKNNCITNP